MKAVHSQNKQQQRQCNHASLSQSSQSNHRSLFACRRCCSGTQNLPLLHMPYSSLAVWFTMNLCSSFGKRLSGRFKLHEAIQQGTYVHSVVGVVCRSCRASIAGFSVRKPQCVTAPTPLLAAQAAATAVASTRTAWCVCVCRQRHSSIQQESTVLVCVALVAHASCSHTTRQHHPCSWDRHKSPCHRLITAACEETALGSFKQSLLALLLPSPPLPPPTHTHHSMYLPLLSACLFATPQVMLTAWLSLRAPAQQQQSTTTMTRVRQHCTCAHTRG